MSGETKAVLERKLQDAYERLMSVEESYECAVCDVEARGRKIGEMVALLDTAHRLAERLLVHGDTQGTRQAALQLTKTIRAVKAAQ